MMGRTLKDHDFLLITRPGFMCLARDSEAVLQGNYIHDRESHGTVIAVKLILRSYWRTMKLTQIYMLVLCAILVRLNSRSESDESLGPVETSSVSCILIISFSL